MRAAQIPEALVSNLTGPPHEVFVAGQLLDSDRAARVKLVGADADLGAHAELGAVRKLRGRIVQHDGAVDLGEKLLGRGGILRDDAVGMLRTITRDVSDGCIEAVDYAHGND